MNKSEFHSFVKAAHFQGEPLVNQMEETHISWIAFSEKWVFKIKKPVKLSFLDFSTLSLRKKYCERELRLNQRYSKIYLDVLPVIKREKGWYLGKGEGDIVDYAVRMERMDSSKRMDKMLRENQVSKASMHALAREVADFHQKAEVINTPFDIHKAKSLFNDIGGVGGFIGKEMGKDQKNFILRSMEWSNRFLESYAVRIQERIDRGFQRDLHGDLHGGNIFLYDQPVLFDCIEFSDEYRQIDVLYEIAFLGMELETGGHRELALHFLKQYSQMIPCIETPEDKVLYLYFKCLRANIRAKVLTIQEEKNPNHNIQPSPLEAIQKYLSRMEKYINETELCYG